MDLQWQPQFGSAEESLGHLRMLRENPHYVMKPHLRGGSGKSRPLSAQVNGDTDGAIVPALKRGKTVLIAAHGNSIRGMVKALDGIGDSEIVGLEIPTGVPLLYHLDADLKPLKDPRSFGLLSGAFLGDPEEIKAAQEKVAAQTKVEDTSVESEEEGKKRILEEARGV